MTKQQTHSPKQHCIDALVIMMTEMARLYCMWCSKLWVQCTCNEGAKSKNTCVMRQGIWYWLDGCQPSKICEKSRCQFEHKVPSWVINSILIWKTSVISSIRKNKIFFQELLGWYMHNSPVFVLDIASIHNLKWCIWVRLKGCHMGALP